MKTSFRYGANRMNFIEEQTARPDVLSCEILIDIGPAMFRDEADIFDGFGPKRPIFNRGVVIVGFIDDIRLFRDGLQVTDVFPRIMLCRQSFRELEWELQLLFV